jgi:hypothetical protein
MTGKKKLFGSLPTPKFTGLSGGPIWDGTSPSRNNLDDYKPPDPNDWFQLISELQATQRAIQIPAWTAFTLTNGWVAGANPPGFRMVNNHVFLKGFATPGTTADGTTIFTLPVINRPANALTFGIRPTAGNPNINARLLIGTDGTGKVYDVGAAANLNVNGVHFWTDQ